MMIKVPIAAVPSSRGTFIVYMCRLRQKRNLEIQDSCFYMFTKWFFFTQRHAYSATFSAHFRFATLGIPNNYGVVTST